MESKHNNIIHNLESYRNLSKTVNNHKQLLKDKTVILYAATLLNNRNSKIVNLCLDVIENIVQNEKTHSSLLATFGLHESLEALTINARDYNKEISDRANKLIQCLQRPAYGMRLRSSNARIHKRRTIMYHLHVPDLTVYNRSVLDETLVSTKGIISFVVDVEQQRCTIRIGTNIPLNSIILKLQDVGLLGLVIVKDPNTKKEIHVDVLSASNDATSHDYIQDDDTLSPTRKKTIHYFAKHITENAGSIFKTASDIWNRSFYW